MTKKLSASQERALKEALDGLLQPIRVRTAQLIDATNDLVGKYNAQVTYEEDLVDELHRSPQGHQPKHDSDSDSDGDIDEVALGVHDSDSDDAQIDTPESNLLQEQREASMLNRKVFRRKAVDQSLDQQLKDFMGGDSDSDNEKRSPISPDGEYNSYLVNLTKGKPSPFQDSSQTDMDDEMQEPVPDRSKPINPFTATMRNNDGLGWFRSLYFASELMSNVEQERAFIRGKGMKAALSPTAKRELKSTKKAGNPNKKVEASDGSGKEVPKWADSLFRASQKKSSGGFTG